MKEFRAVLPHSFLYLLRRRWPYLRIYEKEGASGVVSVASHIAGKQIHDMISAFNNNNITTAKALDAILQPLFDVLLLPVTQFQSKPLKLIGFNCGTTRPPLMSITDGLSANSRNCIGCFFRKSLTISVLNATLVKK